MSHFGFLAAEWPDIFEPAAKAEASAVPDPRSACFHARRALELTVHWLYKHDATLTLPYQDHLSALIHEPDFRRVAGAAIFAKARVIKDLGNLAVHSTKPVRAFDAIMATKELFHVLFWLARTYARGAKPPDTLRFDQTLLPKTAPVPPQTQNQLQQLEASLRERDEKLAELLSGRQALDAELESLRAQIAEIKAANASRPDAHDYSEAETRDYFIDLLLKEAGWPLDKPGHDTEFQVPGMPNKEDVGYVDYVLWGDDGKPLGLVEAKRTRFDARKGQRQAELYADALEKQFGQRPIIFYSNGYEHWLWDDAMYPPRPVQGFYKKDELELLIQRRQMRRRLAETPINEEIVERPYQHRAIRRIGETFENDNQRKALIVMATGAGKTRTVIALVDQLMRANWAKRVLFLADRVALVDQAIKAFKRHLPDVPPVNLVTEKNGQGRVYVSTYPTMMGLIDDTRDGQRRFGPGHFDLIIIDEAHRSVYQKYGAIFEYFDSLLVGLTATPKEEIDRNTYRLFELENGVPTDAYTLEEAVRDRYLVPPRSVSVDLKFPQRGIKYDDLSEEEKEKWDALEWDEDGQVPNEIDAAAVNRWLFNEDTVDKVLEHLMTHGQKVAGGDRLGKTVIFAKNKEHAEFIVERFDKNYPRHKGVFARAIHFKVDYVKTLIEAFYFKERPPHIAVSVDMLDTGIDVPEIVNLVFFKPIRSKTKFWQMIGRGTRLCPDLFGPGQDKENFTVFDFCRNLEFFTQDIPAAPGSVADSLGKKLFKTRVDLIAELDKQLPSKPRSPGMSEEAPGAALREDTATLLVKEVAAMNIDNFIVRPKRRLVEKYAKPESWKALDQQAQHELTEEVAGLPAELDPEDEEAKRFDLLMLNLQLAALRHAPGFARLQEKAQAIANALQEKVAIPMVQQQIELIMEIAGDEWWQDVTVTMLEDARKRLRSLIKFIDKGVRRIVYTDFEDELGGETEVVLPGIGIPAHDFERFRAKARHFLKAHLDHVAVQKLRLNKPLTATDLTELERILVESGIGTAGDVARAQEESHGLGLFVRSLVGLDREAAKQAFAGFMTGKTLSANQLEFIDMIINHLTYNGAMDSAALYASPYTDRSPKGIDGVFAATHSAEIISILDEVRRNAAA